MEALKLTRNQRKHILTGIWFYTLPPHTHTHSHIPEMTKTQYRIHEITIFKIWASGSKRHNICNVKQELTARRVSKHGAGAAEQCSEVTELSEERSRKCWETCRGPSLQVRMADPMCVGTPPEAWKDLVKRTRGHYRASHGPAAGLLPSATLRNPISHRHWVECSKKIWLHSWEHQLENKGLLIFSNNLWK